VTLSIRQRLTLWYAGATSLLLAAVAISLIVLLQRMHAVRLDAELLRVNSTVAAVLQHELDEGLAPKAAVDDALNEVQVAGRDLAVFATDGTVLGVRGSPQLRATVGRPTGDALESFGDDDTGFRVATRVTPPVPAGFVIVTAAPASELARERRELVKALALVIPAALLVTACGAWWVAGRAMRPAAHMAAEVERITGDIAGARLTIERDDELGRVAFAFNALVHRLESALIARRHFLADVSHELRTPVTVARAAADVALSRATRSEAEYRESLRVISEQLAHLTEMVGDLLTLARNDITDWPIVPHDFYLDELIDDVLRTMRVVADKCGVSLRSSAPRDLQFTGDEHLLRRMVLNLVDNAIRHTTSGGEVELIAELTANALALRVRDTGSGVTLPDGERLFDRFVKLHTEEERGRLGLGLAIARRIARVHGGDVTLESTSAAGSTFLINLPRQRA
jgi:signal transduction histidine kinase